jgi:transposase
MRKVQERNLQIVEMSRAGAPHPAIARQFNLSRSSVDVIVHKFEEQRQLAERSTRLRDEIRQADDLDREWPAADLVAALGLLTVTTTALTRYFEDQGTTAISLRALMDMAISAREDPRTGYLITPLLDVRFVGKKGFWSVINRITDLDLGSRCEEEWHGRVARLRQCWRIHGALPYSWSKPVSPASEFGRLSPVA